MQKLPICTYDQLKNNSKILPGIDYKLDVYGGGETGKVRLLFNGAWIDKNTVIRRISIVFPASNLFSNVEMADGGNPFHVDFVFEVKEDMLMMLTGLPFAFTLSVFPMMSHTDFALTAKVYHNYTFIKEYEYKDGIKQCMGLFFLGQGSSFPEVEAYIIDQMLLSFLNDFKKDFIASEKI